MKKAVFILFTGIMSLYGSYGLYDIVENFSWQDSDGGTPVQRSLYDLIDSGKVVLLTWGYNG